MSYDGYRRGLRALPALLRFGLKITPGGIAQGVSQQAGIWAVGAVAPVALVGAYSRAQTIPDRLQQVNFRVVEVLYPTLVGRRAKGDGAGFDRALVDTMRYALTGMLLIASVCAGGAHAILSLFGPGFSLADSAFALLIAYPALAAVASAQTQALWALDRPGLTSVIALGRLGVTIGLTVVLTPKLGLVGPAIGLLGGFLLDIACKVVALRDHLSSSLRQSWPITRRLALLAAYICGFAASRACGQLIGGASLLPSLLAGTAAYIAALVLAGGVDPRDRERVSEIVAAARARRRSTRSPGGQGARVEQPAAAEELLGLAAGGGTRP